MEEEPSKQIKKIRKELVEAKCSISNGNPEATAVICSLASYLREKEEFINVCVQACNLFEYKSCSVCISNRGSICPSVTHTIDIK